LRESEERFRIATQAGKIGVWDWDILADRILWSESLYTIYGVTPGKTHTIEDFRARVHPDDRDMVRSAIGNALEHDSPSELEYRAVRPDGKIVWLFINAKVIRSDGRPVRMVGSTLDITERKRVEIALRESEQRFVKAFSASPLCLTISSLATGKLLEVNEAFVAVTGYSRDEAIGRTTAELGVWVQPNEREEELTAVEAAGSLRNREYRFRMRNGQEITGLLSAEVIDVAGERCALTVIQDITDRTKYEEALRVADRRKDEFIATLAHELRNPLAPIRNGIELLKRAADDPVRNAEVLAMMDRQLAQMVRLVDDLLDVSRISRGKFELRTEPIELSKAVRNAVESCRPTMDSAGHHFVVSDPDETILVQADLARLSQVIANLLDNAAKYSPRGSTIRLSVESGPGEAVVRVRDNGIGIPTSMLPQVFEMFTRADTSLEKPQSGLGIGLTIVKRLVEMHGGSIEAHSEGEGKGSEFVVRLPRLGSSPAQEDSAFDATPDVTHCRVLVVDDNRDSAESMAMVLGAMGHETRIAYDGRQALASAESFQPDMILLDIGMPVMNGYEACRRIRELPWGRNVMVVAMTGWGHLQDRERSRNAGFDHHLTKPVDVASLQQLLADRTGSGSGAGAPSSA
jgi:PAS domain S-box-containing protein